MPYPVPTVIKQLRGTDQPCRLVPDEPQPAGIPSPTGPAFLNERQRTIWAEVLEQSPVGLLHECDSALILQYVVASELYETAAADVAAKGYTVTYRGRLAIHPAVYVMNSQALILRQCIQELGFTPAARTRIAANADAAVGMGGAADSAWEQLAMPLTG